MTSMFRWLVSGLLAASLTSSHRTTHEVAHLGEDLQATSEISRETVRAKKRCQYSAGPHSAGIPIGRPFYKSMIAVCPQNRVTKACKDAALAKGSDVEVLNQAQLTHSDCENLCNEDTYMLGSVRNGARCAGYVTRKPFNEDVEKGKPQCWLIKGSAERSRAFPDEVKIDRASFDSGFPKLTFIKEYCGCEARFVHFKRPEWKTDLALKRRELKELRKEDPTSEVTKDLSAEVSKLEHEEERWERLEKFEGLYDWLPMRPPHRIHKGGASYVPNWVAKKFKKGIIEGQKGAFSYFWESPIRIRNIFKKADLSSFLYLCMNKSSGHESWYLATQTDPVLWAAERLKLQSAQTNDDLKKALGEDLTLIQKIFFRMECLGTKIELDNKVSYEAPGGLVVESRVDGEFLNSNEKGETPEGCFESLAAGEQPSEEKVVSEVGSCPIEGLTQQTSDSSAIGLNTLWNADANMLDKLSVAQRLVDAANNHKRLGSWGIWAAKLAIRGYDYVTGKQQDADVKHLKDFSTAELQAMMERLAVLLRGLSNLFLTMEAAQNTDDPQIKLVCAKELLGHIFDTGGLLPKVSQNLAMRPDLVPDDFLRNKLKETQNANPSRSEAATLEYLNLQEPKIKVPGFDEELALTDVLKYKKALSAGSVGQVDLFDLRTDIDEKLKKGFRTLLPEGHGDTVIVKTVFQETEASYMNDWNLLEQFFETKKEDLDTKLSIMWDVLSPMKKSIFDEFDLREEAKFTKRGQDMLKDFTDLINQGAYAPTLTPGSIKLTTPNAVATTSPYILIQSLAPGIPLKNHLEQSVGQIEKIAEWKETIYASILMVYGHMVVKHGFFQSDPHNGNWFWDEGKRTVTLIDWGGVGQLDEKTHCNLANLYSRITRLTKDWEDCAAIVLEGNPYIAGTYVQMGFSVYDAGDGDKALLLGKTYGASYYNPERRYRLWYDGTRWVISFEHPGRQELHEVMAELPTQVSDLHALVGQRPKVTMRWTVFPNGDKDRKTKKDLATVMKIPNTVCKGSRRKAYAKAAALLGLNLTLTCEPEDIVVLPEAPLTQEDAESWKDNGNTILSCVKRTEDGSFVRWGTHNPMKLAIEERDGRRFVELPDGTRDLDIAPSVEMQKLDWVSQVFSARSKEKVGRLSPTKHSMLLQTAESQLAVATALYDSDILTAAVLGLDARSSVGLLMPEVSEEYVLLARCIVVFHGMLGDVVKENFMRLIVAGQESYLQWLLRSNGERFFRSWAIPADEYLSNSPTCTSEGWDHLVDP